MEVDYPIRILARIEAKPSPSKGLGLLLTCPCRFSNLPTALNCVCDGWPATVLSAQLILLAGIKLKKL